MSRTQAPALGAEPFAATLDTDTLIVGGGIAGIATAYFLAREGVETILIDRADFGAYSSGANSGNLHRQLLADNYHRFGWDWFERWSIIGPYFTRAGELWRALFEAHGQGLKIVRAGGLMVAELAEDLLFLARKVELERAYGLEIELVRGNELRNLAGYLTERAIGAAYCPAEGHINPLTALPALLEAAESTGELRAFRHCELVDGQKSAAGFVVSTTRGRIKAKRIVNAAGAGARRVSARFGCELPIRTRVIQSIVTEPVEPILPHMLYHARGQFTMKQLTNGNVVIGGGWPARLDERTDLPVTTRSSLAGSLGLASTMVRGAGELRMLRSWAGKVFTCDDGLPVVGETARAANFYHAVPNVFGLTLGPLIGQLTAELMMAKRPGMDVSPFALERPGMQ